MHGRNHKGEFSCDRGLPFSRLYTRSSKCGIGRSLHCRALPAFVVDGIVTGEQDLRNRYDLIPLGEQVVEDIRQRLGRMLARIVEQHDRPALHLARHTLRDLTRRDALPVEGVPTGSTWKRLSCLASWPPLTVFFPPIHSPPLNMPRINSILVKCTRHTAGTAAAELRQQFCEIQSAFAQISQTGTYQFFGSTGIISGGMQITAPVPIFVFRCAAPAEMLSASGSFSIGFSTLKFFAASFGAEFF